MQNSFLQSAFLILVGTIVTVQCQNLYGSPMWAGGYYGNGGRGYFGAGLAPGSAGMIGNVNGQQYPYVDPQTYWLMAGGSTFYLGHSSVLAMLILHIFFFI